MRRRRRFQSAASHGENCFQSDHDGNLGDIFIANADGSALTRLTTDPAMDKYPCFSPDGAKIAFVSDREGSDQVYIMNADGSGSPTQITSGGNWASQPCSSPDGSKIVYELGVGNGEIYAVNVDGSSPTYLADGSSPCYSPDGSGIVCLYPDGGNWEVYTMYADGSNRINITNDPSVDYEPSWGG